MKKILKVLIGLAAVLADAGPGLATTYFSDNFDGYADSPLNHGWTLEDTSMFTANATGGRGDNGRCVSFHFHSQTNTSGYAFGMDPGPGVDFKEGYIRFSFKILNNSTGEYNTKFMKMFTAPTNTSYYSHYTGTFLTNVQTGDGTAMGDSNCRWDFDGSSPSGCTQSVYTGTSPTGLNDGEWHTYEIYFKQNTDDASDGALRVWIDGDEKLTVAGMKVRHNLCPTDIVLFQFPAYSYTGSDGDWDLYLDDVVSSDTYIGVPGDAPPAEPVPVTQAQGVSITGGSLH